MEETGGCSSGYDKRPKLEAKDRISDLPDALIQLILSFLPSTKQAIQTGILSKRWQDQWTRVPVLIFNSSGKNDKNFSNFINNTLILHNCPKIKKFHIQYDCHLQSGPELTPKICFATRKYVAELILHCYCYDWEDAYVLPKFVHTNASLINLELFNCCLDDWEVNWSSLKVLKLECSTLHIPEIENAVSGSPVLEFIELTSCDVVNGGVIASKSLKRLIFVNVYHGENTDSIEILCPNLEELSVQVSGYFEHYSANFPYETIQNVLSGCLLLSSLELRNFLYYDLVIASDSLKNLVLGENDGSSGCAIEISCPNLEELNLYDMVISSLKLMKLGSLVWATLHFDCPLENYNFNTNNQNLEQLQHVKELTIGGMVIKILSDLAVEGLSSPLLNCRSLTLDGTNFDEHLPGILCVIHSSPKLEKLVIKLRLHQCQMNADLPRLNDCEEKNYWNSYGTVFNCSVSQLKTVKILGLSGKDSQCKLVLHFVEFLLKNAMALEKIALVLEDGGVDFVDKVSQFLFSIPNRHAIVEIFYSN